MADEPTIVPNEYIDSRICWIRGDKVILDNDLATLYGVGLKTLNQAVKRNITRFPSDFMFQLKVEEADLLRSQSVTLKAGRGQHSKYLPHAFTEQGIAMLSSVLHSERAILVNIEIMRAFVRLRQMLASNTELAAKLDALEMRYDEQFREIFDTIRQLMAAKEPPNMRPIGFAATREDER